MTGLQDYLPSYKQGVALSAGDSNNPLLWDRLVGAWIPDLGITGPIVRDVSGNRCHGTWAGTGTSHWLTDWHHAFSMGFNGSDDAVNLGATVLPFGLEDFSIVANFRAVTAANQFRTIITKTKAASGVGRWGLFLQATKLTVLGTDNNLLAIQVDIAETPYIDGKWHSVCGVWNRRKQLELWTEGQLRGVNTNLATYPGVSYTNGYVCGIGAYDNSTGTALTQGWWDGAIGPILAYNRVLTPSEIALLSYDPYAPFRLSSSKCNAFVDTTTTLTMPLFQMTI